MTLRGFLNLARTDAGRAHAQTAGGPFDDSAHRLKVYVPAALGYVVGVTDLVAKLRTAATHIANSCHYRNLPEGRTRPLQAVIVTGER